MPAERNRPARTLSLLADPWCHRAGDVASESPNLCREGGEPTDSVRMRTPAPAKFLVGHENGPLPIRTTVGFPGA